MGEAGAYHRAAYSTVATRRASGRWVLHPDGEPALEAREADAARSNSLPWPCGDQHRLDVLLRACVHPHAQRRAAVHLLGAPLSLRPLATRLAPHYASVSAAHCRYIFDRVFLLLWISNLPASLGVVVVLAMNRESLIVRREVKEGMVCSSHPPVLQLCPSHPASTRRASRIR